jgi:predicted RNase H-like nuclease
LKTKASGSVATPALIETYPHPALLTLCDAPLRVQYKVAKWRRYWPGAKPKEAVHLLLEQFRRIVRALCDNGVRGLVLPFDLGEDFLSPTRLKPFEDALDAVVSAWVGVTYRNGRAQAFGDDSAAIWVPAHGC